MCLLDILICPRAAQSVVLLPTFRYFFPSEQATGKVITVVEKLMLLVLNIKLDRRKLILM